MSQTVTLQIELLYDIGASATFVAVRYALLRIPSSVLIWLREAYELRHSQYTNSRGPALPFTQLLALLRLNHIPSLPIVLR